MQVEAGKIMIKSLPQPAGGQELQIVLQRITTLSSCSPLDERPHRYNPDLALNLTQLLILLSSYSSSLRAATPGKTFPSKNSKEAPPPVET